MIRIELIPTTFPASKYCIVLSSGIPDSDRCEMRDESHRLWKAACSFFFISHIHVFMFSTNVDDGQNRPMKIFTLPFTRRLVTTALSCYARELWHALHVEVPWRTTKRMSRVLVWWVEHGLGTMHVTTTLTMPCLNVYNNNNREMEFHI
jgi:hypothetical protein